MISADERVLSLSDAKNWRMHQAGLGNKVVFTNGVYDLIHPGHIRFLQEARNLGDCMIVAVNSDSSVKRLKGDSRPLLPEHERARIATALESVDIAVIFEEDSPLETVNALRPDILVKGGDYAIDTIVGRNEVEGWGGKVFALPFHSGYSTSHIIERIISSHIMGANEGEA